MEAWLFDKINSLIFFIYGLHILNLIYVYYKINGLLTATPNHFYLGFVLLVVFLTFCGWKRLMHLIWYLSEIN